ncbi:uncharacterized protein [Dysidea avara]|uniref:uncharacterized protein isoform X2 n=1 Tax=Dysidea avara TaxID=196820 RepID=UPI00331A735F
MLATVTGDMSKGMHQSLTGSRKLIVYRKPGFTNFGDPVMDKAIERLAGGGSHVSGGNAPSKGFQMLIKGIAEAKTKHEEDRLIRNEAMFLKDRIGDPEITGKQMRELLIRLLYCEMLGQDCNWGYIHAVKLTQKGTLNDKRIGYLTVSLCLQEGNELSMLLVNTLQKDLKSANIIEVSMAMNVICRLVTKEMIPAFVPLIQEKMVHPKELIRKKALMVMHRFYLLSPSSITHLFNDIRRCLSDSDPGVMDTCLEVLIILIKDNPDKFKDLTCSLVHIMDQVINRKLPPDFDYHGVPSPWTQMKLLRLFSILGADDQTTSGVMYKAIQDSLGSAECTSNIGLAITYECIKTITTIYHNPSLVSKAAHSIGRFLNSTNNNWKCLGITALGLLVQVDTQYTLEHQLVVIDCLDDPDDTLKRKTLSLLFMMTNSLNVVVIAEKMIAYLKTTRDEYIKADLVSKITQLAERYAPDNQWFIRTMNIVFEVGGDLVRKEVAHNLMRLIAEGSEDDDVDNELRMDAVTCYLELISKPSLPDILIKIICWVVGEYAYLCEDVSSEEILKKITSLLNRKFDDKDTPTWVITAITKLVSQMGNFADEAQSHIACYLASVDIDMQQRCSELAELSQNLSLMQQVLPVDASCEDVEVDSSLSFLDDYVSEALEKGDTPYKPAHVRKAERAQEEEAEAPLSPEIKFKPYEKPSTQPMYHVPPSATTYTDNTTPSPVVPSPAPHVNSVDMVTSRGQNLYNSQDDYSYKLSDSPRLPVKGTRVWGSSGYLKTATYPTISPSETVSTSNHIDSVEEEPRRPSVEEEPYNEVPQETTTAPSRVTAVPVLSAEEVKKRELASALFGGGGGMNREGMLTGTRTPRKQKKTTESSSSTVTPKRTPSNTSDNTRKGSAPNVTQTNLLLDIDFSSPSTTIIQDRSNSVPNQQTVNNESTTMFDSLDVQTQPVTTSTSTTATTSGGLFGDLVDLFGSSGPSTSNNRPAPSVPSQYTQSSINTSSSLPSTTSSSTSGRGATDSFASLLDTPGYSLPSKQPAPPTAEVQDKPLAIALFDSPLSELRIPAELEVFPVAPGGSNLELCCDDTLRVTVTKVMKPKELILVLFLTNQKQVNLVDVITSVNTSSNLEAKLTNPHDNNSFLDQLSSFATIRHLCTVVPVSPGHNMNVHGKITYKVNLSTKRLFFDLNIQSVDLIRPLLIDTDSFGKKWGSFKNEKRHKKVSSHIKTPEMYMEVVKTKLNLHPIQIIGKEAIAAGTFLPSTPCLLHGKLSSAGLDVWVKSTSSVLTESFNKEVLTVFGVS